MKVVLAGSLLCWLLLSMTGRAGAQGKGDRPRSDLTKAIVKVSPSIVQINLVFRDYPEATKEVLEGIPGTAWNERSRCPDPCLFFDQPIGTGFLVNDDGYVITARHVMETLHNFKILHNGTPLDLGHSFASVRVQMPNTGEIGENGSALPPGPLIEGPFGRRSLRRSTKTPSTISHCSN